MSFAVTSYEPAWSPRQGRICPGIDPHPATLDLDGLGQWMTEPRRVEDRDAIWCWAPHTLADGQTRRLQHVVEVSCLVLDFDDGTPIEVGRSPWMCWQHFWHTSRSHQVDAHRFRVVMPLEVPVPVSFWPRAWRWAEARAGQTIDKACKDASRVYYLPAIVPGGYFDAGAHEGPLLDLRPFRELPVEPRPPRPPPPIPCPARSGLQAALRTPEGRHQAAIELGGHLDTYDGHPVARRITCPECQRPSVWFLISGWTSPKARCSHKHSCDWSGFIDQLL